MACFIIYLLLLILFFCPVMYRFRALSIMRWPQQQQHRQLTGGAGSAFCLSIWPSIVSSSVSTLACRSSYFFIFLFGRHKTITGPDDDVFFSSNIIFVFALSLSISLSISATFPENIVYPSFTDIVERQPESVNGKCFNWFGGWVVVLQVHRSVVSLNVLGNWLSRLSTID